MYRGADQAIECVSSVLRSEHSDFRILLLDNKSPDVAFERMRAWANGEIAPPSATGGPLPDHTVARGPIDHQVLEPGAALPAYESLRKVTLIQTGANLGYAGGNNVALRSIKDRDDWDYAWILNPDTVVEPGTMSALLARIEREPRLSPVGARISFYDTPDTLQQWGGGAYRRLRGAGRNLGLGHSASEPVDQAAIERELDYVSGSSLFFSNAFLTQAGLMEESYFLYFEEVDWCLKRGDFKLGYAHDARVYHRHGGSIGSSTKHTEISPLSLRWSYRNRFVFTRKFLPWALPTVYLGTFFDMARMASKGSWKNAWLIFKVVHGLEPVTPPSA
jgi:hypothetical protein